MDIHFHIATCTDIQECSLYILSCTPHGKIGHSVHRIESSHLEILGDVQRRYQNCTNYQGPLDIPVIRAKWTKFDFRISRCPKSPSCTVTQYLLAFSFEHGQPSRQFSPQGQSSLYFGSTVFWKGPRVVVQERPWTVPSDRRVRWIIIRDSRSYKRLLISHNRQYIRDHRRNQWCI